MKSIVNESRIEQLVKSFEFEKIFIPEDEELRKLYLKKKLKVTNFDFYKLLDKKKLLNEVKIKDAKIKDGDLFYIDEDKLMHYFAKQFKCTQVRYQKKWREKMNFELNKSFYWSANLNNYQQMYNYGMFNKISCRSNHLFTHYRFDGWSFLFKDNYEFVIDIEYADDFLKILKGTYAKIW